RVDEAGIDGEALVGRERARGAQGDQRIAAARGADVEVAVALDDRDLVAGGALAEHDRGSVGRLRVAELDGAGSETAASPEGGADAARTRHRHGGGRRGGVGAGGPGRAVLVADGFDDGVGARPRKGVCDLHTRDLRAVAEVPDDLGAFGDGLALAEGEWNRG